MPCKCCVPGCKSNYKTKYGENRRVSIFKFPKSDEQRAQWIRSIPRKNWEPTKNSGVSEIKIDYQEMHIT